MATGKGEGKPWINTLIDRERERGIFLLSTKLFDSELASMALRIGEIIFVEK